MAESNDRYTDVKGSVRVSTRSINLKSILKNDRDPLSPIDVDKATEQLHIIETAKNMGEHHLPNKDDPLRVSAELDIDHVYQAVVTQYYDYAAPVIGGYDDQLVKESQHIAQTLADSQKILTKR